MSENHQYQPPIANQTSESEPPPRSHGQPNSSRKKRQLNNNNNDDVKIEDINKFNMRLLITNLRPHIMEVLRTPDFRNCNSTRKIQQDLNTLRKLCKETAAVNNGVTQRPQSQLPDIKPAEHSGNVSKKQRTENGQLDTLGSYIVGGSAFGWNFITFSGNDAVYYGRTKEAFRSSQPTQQGSQC
ncbi:hypothetical protein ACFE04_026481 [Oxalis oulophora]